MSDGDVRISPRPNQPASERASAGHKAVSATEQGAFFLVRETYCGSCGLDGLGLTEGGTGAPVV